MRETKRIVIISPNTDLQRNLEGISRSYIRHNFKDLGRFESQVFRDVGDSYEKRAEVGKGGELAVVLDEAALSPPGGSELAKHMRSLINALRGLCEEKDIPYIPYFGETRLGMEDYMLKNLEMKSEQISKRILDPDMFVKY